MNKTLTYSSFVIAALVVITAFITATSYTQLGIAVLLYPLLVFFAYKVFQPKLRRYTLKTPAIQVQSTVESAAKVEDTKRENIGITDIDKRIFLKLIGATGLSFFLISIFGRRIENALFGQKLGMQPPSADKIPTATTAPTDGYAISEIDDSVIGYYGFINKDGAWFIMKRDTESGSFRYVRGSSDFPKNWKNRENLKYDFFHDVFVY